MFRTQAAAGLLALLGLAACSTNPTIPAGPASLEVVGTPAGTPGWLLDDPLAIKVLDAAGDPVAGATVSWSTAEPGAWLASATTTTDASGTATVEFAPGWRAGEQVVRAATAGVTAQLSVTATSLQLIATAAAEGAFCGLDVNGALWCWQIDALPHTREAPLALVDENRPVRVDPDRHFVAIVGSGAPQLGGDMMCALSDVAELRCWHADAFAPETWPTPAPFTAIAMTGRPGTSLCGLDAAGTVWCRGNNASGQLGDGTTTRQDDFVAVAEATPFAELVAGYDAFCALDAGQHAWCWGDGPTLRGGFGSDDVLVPTRFGGDLRWHELRFIYYGVCGLGASGHDLRCWGGTGMTGATDASTGGVAITTGDDVAELAGSYGFGLFRMTNGTLRIAGQLGHDPFVFDWLTTPTPLETMPSPVSAVLTAGGDAWCVTHQSGSTICGRRVAHPVGVPLPRTS